MRFIAVGFILLVAQGCSTWDIAKGVLSSSLGSGPSASLEVDVGDKEVARGATIGSATTKQETKLETVTAAKDVKLDQSSKKQDKKTEIGEVKGDVSVHQGPSLFHIILLSLGWPLFVCFLIYSLVRSKQHG